MMRFSITARAFAFATLMFPFGVFAASVSADGAAALNTMLAEHMDYILNQGGPFENDEAINKATASLFWTLDHPNCPHCLPKPLPTEEQEVETSKAMQTQAEAGDASAQYTLGARYLRGKGLPNDTTRGIAWIQKAADNGQIDAAYTLGKMYDMGLYVKVDKQKAVQLYERGIDAVGAKLLARQRLGQMYEFGIGVPVDYARAMMLYQQAERIPLLLIRPQVIEVSIGRLYAQGKGVPQDYAMAAEWFLKAADQGKSNGNMFSFSEGDCALAIMYAAGLGVQRDNKQRDFWLNRPNVRNLKTCRTLLDESRADTNGQP